MSIQAKDLYEQLVELQIQKLIPQNLVNYCLTELTDLSELDPESTAPFCGEEDLSCMLHSVVQNIEREESLDSLLISLTFEKPEMGKLYSQIEDLADQEMARFNLEFKDPNSWFYDQFTGVEQEHELVTKLSIVAEYRTKASIAHHPAGREEADFDISLIILKCGDVGSPEINLLRLSKKTSFHAFLAALQDATQLCTVPPIDITAPKPLPPGWNDDDPTLLRKSYPKSIRRFPLGCYYTPEGRVSYKSPIKREVRGYVLSDGPWCYKLVRDSELQASEWSSISDEASFENMLLQMSCSEKIYPDAKHGIAVIHSLELELRVAWDKRHREEQLEEEEFEEELGDQDLFENGDDEVDGESWMDWLKRTQC